MILDILIYTASYDADVWYKLTLIHENFKEYAHSPAGITLFETLFTERVINVSSKYHDQREICYKLFGKKHRRNNPAVIRGDGIIEWRINGVLHRDDDQPAIINNRKSLEWRTIFKQYYVDLNIINAPKNNILYEWWFNGKRNRFLNDAPAIIRNESWSYGKKSDYDYILNHKIYTEDCNQYTDHINNSTKKLA
jgi:hypothetical protein